MDRKRKKGILHRVIIENDKSKIFSLVEESPSLNPGLILAAINCFNSMRKHPQGKNATPLIVAIHMGAIEMCRYLIEEGADVNWGYLDNMTPLCLALNHKHYDIAELLVESGANVHSFDREGRAPLHHAIDVDSPVSFVKTILSAGFPKDGVIADNGLIKVYPLVKAITAKNVPIVKFLLEQKVDVNVVNTLGLTPLILAIVNLSSEIVELLINHGANIEGFFDIDPPPLFMAVQNEDTSTLMVLLDAGVDINRLFTPLEYVFNTLMIPFATALQVAILCSNFQATKQLLSHGANINAINPLSDATALHFIFSVDSQQLDEKRKHNHRKIIKCLLENGADVNAQDIEGKLPVHQIFSSKNWIALKEYIQFGTNLNQTLSPTDGSILRFVICNKQEDLVKLCLAYGANCNQMFHGKPIYNDVIRSDCPEILRLFWKYTYPFNDVPSDQSLKNTPKVFKLLKTQLLFKKGITDNNIEFVEKALMQGAVVNCQFKDLCDYPLHICSARGNSELVKILLDNGAIISKLNEEGYTALHVAAKAGHLEICKLLLRHGACLDCQGPNRVTPCLLAQEEGQTKVVDFFKSVSVLFSELKNTNTKIIDCIKLKIAAGEFHIFMNCVNRRGNTLLGEALRLNLKDVAMKLMTLRLETDYR